MKLLPASPRYRAHARHLSSTCRSPRKPPRSRSSAAAPSSRCSTRSPRSTRRKPATSSTSPIAPSGSTSTLIRSGKEEFDVAILTPEAIDDLAKEGKVVPGTRADLAKTGVGVVVKAGAPLPDISTVDAFKRTLLAAKSVAYIDPKAGGSSGIYVEASVGSGSASPTRSTPRRYWSTAARSPITSPTAKPRSASTRSAKSCRSPASRWSVRCRPKSRISRSMRRASVLRPRTARRRAHWSSFWPGPHALPIIKAKGMEPASS